VEGELAHVVAEALPEAVATASRREPAATEARTEASTEATQGPALAGSSRVAVVEIPDNDSPPPGWDQWLQLPGGGGGDPGRRLPAARVGSVGEFPHGVPRVPGGALVRWRKGHMVAGGRRRGAEASSSRARSSVPAEGLVGGPPAFTDTQGEQEQCGELHNHGATLDRV
jgi:hypothetical protein